MERVRSDVRFVRRTAAAWVTAVLLLSPFGGSVTAVDRPLPAWVQQSTSTKASLSDLIYAEGLYVAGGENGTLITAPDAIHWTVHQTDVTDPIGSIVYGNGRFVALAESLSGGSGQVMAHVLSSDDGTDWTAVAMPADFWPGTLYFDGNRFIFTGSYYEMVGNCLCPVAKVMASTDGVEWSAVDTAPDPIPTIIGEKNGLLVGATEEAIYTSADGTTWTQEQSIKRVERYEGMSDQFWVVAYGGGTYVAHRFVGEARGYASYLYTSTDAVNWTQTWSDMVLDVNVAYASGYFIGLTGDDRILTSADGTTWEEQSWTDGIAETWDVHLSRVRYLGDRAIIVGSGGLVLTWNPSAPDTAASQCGTFGDVRAENPACQAIVTLADKGIIAGYQDGTFRPANTVTRAEFAKMLALAQGWNLVPGGKLPFPDVSTHWAFQQGYLQAVHAQGAISGFPDGTFGPNRTITRAQMVKIVAAANGLQPVGEGTYSDVWGDAWYVPYVTAAEEALLIGRNAPTPLWTNWYFSPDLPATRAEAAVLLANLLWKE